MVHLLRIIIFCNVIYEGDIATLVSQPLDRGILDEHLCPLLKFNVNSILIPNTVIMESSLTKTYSLLDFVQIIDIIFNPSVVGSDFTKSFSTFLGNIIALNPYVVEYDFVKLFCSECPNISYNMLSLSTLWIVKCDLLKLVYVVLFSTNGLWPFPGKVIF